MSQHKLIVKDLAIKPSAIKQTVFIGNKKILLLKKRPYIYDSENIVCLEDNIIIWKIEPSENLSKYNHYVNIECDGSNLFATDFDGFRKRVDLETGKIMGDQFVK